MKSTVTGSRMPVQVTPQHTAQALSAPRLLKTLPTTAWPKSQDNTEVGIAVASLEHRMEEYFHDCELRLLSPETIDTRRRFYRNFLWFLHRENIAHCSIHEIRRFFHYLIHGHEEAGGRFGYPHNTRPLRPISIRDYYNALRLFFEWLHKENITSESLFKRISPPQARTEIKQPLSVEQLAALMEAANGSSDPLRNCTLIAFLLDTGCRASEVTALKVKDVDLANGRCRVLGKGNKYRTVFVGERTAQSLMAYLDAAYGLHIHDMTRNKICEDWSLFYSGVRMRINPISNQEVSGEEQFAESAITVFRDPRGNLLRIPPPMQRSGLLHLFKRLGKRAGIKDAVCLHAFRRTFAIEMLRSGAHVFGVQALLGHTDLAQTRKYCAVALSDAETQHRKYSPMDRLQPLITA